MVQYEIIDGKSETKWNKIIDNFELLDVCYLNSYHQAYDVNTNNHISQLYYYRNNNFKFIYPFTLIKVKGATYSKYNAICSTYGYSGPQANFNDKALLRKAWYAFDEWCSDNNVIAEFTRYSSISDNHHLHHPEANVEFNRKIAVTNIKDIPMEILKQYDAKTRNLIRKAEKVIKIKTLKHSHVSEFISMYHSTMAKNNATDFFYYKETYFKKLLNDKSLFDVFTLYDNEEIVGFILILYYKNNAIYHLSAVDQKKNIPGLINYGLMFITNFLKNNGFLSFTLGGGRTTIPNDSLLKFKIKNSNSLRNFYISKRIINSEIYKSIANSSNYTTDKFLFFI